MCRRAVAAYGAVGHAGFGGHAAVDGKEIRVKVVPVDPRSLFRGNYARLNYDFSRLEKGALGGEREKNLRDNEVVYITLRKNQDGLYEYAAASLEKPDAGVFFAWANR